MVENYIEKNNYTVAKYIDQMPMAEHDENFPKKSGGICGGAVAIDYHETKDAIAETKAQIEEYEKQATDQADSEKIEESFTQEIFVVFSSPLDCINVRKK